MAVVTERKEELIKQFRTHDSDTGSAEVQVALLTERIKELSGHLDTHKRDHSCRRSLLVLVGKRSAMLKYVRNKSGERYRALCQKLGIRA